MENNVKVPQVAQNLMDAVTNLLDAVMEVGWNEMKSKEENLNGAYDKAIEILQNCKENNFIKFEE